MRRPAETDAPEAGPDLEAALAGATRRAKAALFWERLWPACLAPLLVVGVFLAASLLGLWILLPPGWRWPVLGLFALAFAASLAPLLRVRWPNEAAALKRLDLETGLAHRPATALADRLSGTRDPMARALFDAHRRRIAERLKRLRAGWPRPRLYAHDPYALRAAVALAVAVAAGMAGPDSWRRLSAAFEGRIAAAREARLDAWVTPPAYTGRPPILLSGQGEAGVPPHAGAAPHAAAVAPRAEAAPIVAPQGSVAVIRVEGDETARVERIDAGGATAASGTHVIEPEQAPAGATIREFKTTLDSSAALRVLTGERERAHWRFAVEPDLPPGISLAKPPEQAQSGALKLAYTMSDDYGVVSAEARFERVAPPAPILGRNRPAPRPLYEAPRFRLNLPQARVKQGRGETLKDETEHPWAGAKVKLTLAARDEAGQEGTSEPHEMRLPERPFHKPLAQAVVEQRRELALDAEARELVLRALDALTLDPERRWDDKVAYLGLRSAYHRLKLARSDDDLRSVVDQLWQVALRLEDGDLSAAERDLRAATDALQRALENGASDQEIQRLMQELREALNRYMQQMLAEAMRRPPEPLPPNARAVRPQDLDRMLRQMENLARSGARDAARQMLSELRNMLENLRNARPMPGGQNPMNEALNRLNDMIREQQRLMNDTFRLGQQNRQQERGARPGQRRPGNRQGQQQGRQNRGEAEQLRGQQQALREQLEELMRRMQSQGMQPNQRLGEGAEAMQGAEQALGQGESEDAVGEQGRALENLRAGMEGLAQQMREQMGQGPGRGPETGFADEDPLGRPRRSEGYEDAGRTKVPDEIETQRARQILDELRRRLGEPARPRLERDYIERLLDRI